MERKVRYILLIVVFFVATVLLSGCEKKTSKAPPKAMVQDALLASLPPYLSLDSIELESIPTGPESVKVNFKAIVTPKEDLYQVDREVEGTPKVTLLKVIQTAGAKASLYGSLEAKRTMDLWTLESPQIEIGLEQFGAPRGTFPPHSYITGSSEATAALRQQAANAAEEERARKAALEQRERERKAQQEREAREQKERQEREEQARIAFEEQQKKEEEQRKVEEEAVRQKLMLATAPGTRYSGTATRHTEAGEEIARFRLVFTEQKGFLIRAEASNPDNAQAKRMFTGELRVDQQPEKETGEVWHIVMSPVGPDAKSGGAIYNFWCSALKLRLTDKGLEGVAKINMFGEDRIIRLQRGDIKGPAAGRDEREPEPAGVRTRRRLP